VPSLPLVYCLEGGAPLDGEAQGRLR
jgi:hypothetical protein